MWILYGEETSCQCQLFLKAWFCIIADIFIFVCVCVCARVHVKWEKCVTFVESDLLKWLYVLGGGGRDRGMFKKWLFLNVYFRSDALVTCPLLSTRDVDYNDDVDDIHVCLPVCDLPATFRFQLVFPYLSPCCDIWHIFYSDTSPFSFCVLFSSLSGPTFVTSSG